MKKLYGFSALILLAVIMFSSCGGGSNPGSLSMTLWEKIKKGNYESAADFWLKNSDIDSDKKKTDEEIKASVTMFAGKMQAQVAQYGGIKSIELIEEKIGEDDMTAKATVKIVYNDGTDEESTQKFVKVDGKWKFDNTIK